VPLVCTYSCDHHCGEWNSIRIDGQLVSDAFSEWYKAVGVGAEEGAAQSQPEAKKLWNQDKPFPCQACCSA
jgi:hypothetical protein